jgi:predicted SprT family Zn-dependent metalloprotease
MAKKIFSLTSEPIEPGTNLEYLTERSGRCRQCNIRYLWLRRLGNLSHMKCPKCGGRLSLTTYRFRGETRWIMKKGA